jgi:GTP cyclohydrolase-4
VIFVVVDPPDIQNRIPENNIPIEKVGVRHFRYPANVEIDHEKQRSVLDIDVSVGLEANKKGASISSITDAILETLNSEDDFTDLRKIPEIIYGKIMQRVPSSRKVEVSVHAEAFLPRMTGFGKRILVSYGTGSGFAVDSELVPSRSVEVSVNGMNACPCSMEKTRSMLISDHPDYEAFLRSIPVITHNQRNIVKIKLTGNDFDISYTSLIDACERVLGLPQMLKYGPDEEGKQLIEAHKNPKFLEDIVREISLQGGNEFAYLPDTVSMKVSCESMETMHPYNLYAEVSMTMKDLRESLKLISGP